MICEIRRMYRSDDTRAKRTRIRYDEENVSAIAICDGWKGYVNATSQCRLSG